MNNGFEMATVPAFVLTACAKLPRICQESRGLDRESNRAPSESKSEELQLYQSALWNRTA
jgi:hypothetical protein